MRQERTVQATIFEVFARHEIGCELKAISQWLDRQRPLVGPVGGAVRRDGVRESGRRRLRAEEAAGTVGPRGAGFPPGVSGFFWGFAPMPAGWAPEEIGAAPDDQ